MRSNIAPRLLGPSLDGRAFSAPTALSATPRGIGTPRNGYVRRRTVSPFAVKTESVYVPPSAFWLSVISVANRWPSVEVTNNGHPANGTCLPNPAALIDHRS